MYHYTPGKGNVAGGSQHGIVPQQVCVCIIGTLTLNQPGAYRHQNNQHVIHIFPSGIVPQQVCVHYWDVNFKSVRGIPTPKQSTCDAYISVWSTTLE